MIHFILYNQLISFDNILVSHFPDRIANFEEVSLDFEITGFVSDENSNLDSFVPSLRSVLSKLFECNETLVKVSLLEPHSIRTLTGTARVRVNVSVLDVDEQRKALKTMDTSNLVSTLNGLIEHDSILNTTGIYVTKIIEPIMKDTNATFYDN